MVCKAHALPQQTTSACAAGGLGPRRNPLPRYSVGGPGIVIARVSRLHKDPATGVRMTPARVSAIVSRVRAMPPGLSFRSPTCTADSADVPTLCWAHATLLMIDMP